MEPAANQGVTQRRASERASYRTWKVKHTHSSNRVLHLGADMNLTGFQRLFQSKKSKDGASPKTDLLLGEPPTNNATDGFSTTNLSLPKLDRDESILSALSGDTAVENSLARQKTLEIKTLHEPKHAVVEYIRLSPIRPH